MPDLEETSGRPPKTDPFDARVVAIYGSELRPDMRPVPDAVILELQGLLARRRQLFDMLVPETNRLNRAHPAARTYVRDHIVWLQQRLKTVDRELDEILVRSPAWRERDACLQSVIGIGPVVSHAVLIDLPELGMTVHKTLARLVGVAPLSSSMAHGARALWENHSRVRYALQIASLVAIRANPYIREHYPRLRAEGKPSKVAQVACMRKLLIALNAVAAKSLLWPRGEAV